MTGVRVLRLWFAFDVPVNRRTYVLNGFGLMAFKYAVDVTVLYFFTHRFWTPFDYFNPLWQVREQLMRGAPDWLAPALVAFALPFLWIGVSMSARRAVDAGSDAWWALLFFVPLLNLVLMLVLSLLPTSPRRMDAVDERLKSAMVALALVVGNTLLTMLIGIYFRRAYSTGLFLGLPFMLGYVTAYTYARRNPDSVTGSVSLALLSVTVAGGAMIVFALEGIVCTAMALPLAWAIAIPGALLGRAVALRSVALGPGVGTALLLMPLIVAVEPKQAGPPHEVVTVVEIAAPPAVVWRNVVTFPKLAPPTELMFRLGVSAPTGARIEGSGVGATRYCDFTTGSFREPVTAWEEGKFLAFDITEQAPPMRELSPYGDIHAPHLDGYFRATHGEFQLIPLANGHTRLVGRTRYQVDMFPQAYWTLFADQIIEAIHRRVLNHIQLLAEKR